MLVIAVVSTSRVHLGTRYSKKLHLLQQKYLQCKADAVSVCELCSELFWNHKIHYCKAAHYLEVQISW